MTKSSNFSILLKQKHANFFPVFLPTSVKIFMTSFKWREAPEIFLFPKQNCMKKAANCAKRRKIFTIFREIVYKKLKLTIGRENREGKIFMNYKNVDILFLQLKIFPVFFKLNLLPPRGSAFGQNIYPCLIIANIVVVKGIILVDLWSGHFLVQDAL